MKKFTIQAIILVAITFIALYLSKSGMTGVPGFFRQTSPSMTQKLTINDTIINVDVADTVDERKKGLSGRASLASDSGILFVYDKEGVYPYWMKGVVFPLDFIWIEGNKVVDILKNIPPADPNMRDADLPRYLPNQPVDMVLEVNAGFVDSHNIKIGDVIVIER